MRSYSLTHLSDTALEHELAVVISREREATAAVLAHIAEFDTRRLYLPAGYPSMHLYCVEALRLSEYSALKRIRAARTARRFPAIFTAVADGRLHLSAVVLLASYLTEGSAAELLNEAAGRTKCEVEALLARRFPRTEVLPLAPAHGPAERPGLELAPGPVQDETVSPASAAPQAESRAERASGRAPEREANSGNLLAPGPVPRPATRSRLTPHAPGRYLLQITVDQELHDLLRMSQDLDSHRLPSGDPGDIIKRALRLYVDRLERRRFAATRRPRARGRGGRSNPRHIPAHVKHAVWKRDGGRCTFVGEGGHQCSARRFLEFDHVVPVARGGRATVAGVRLRCRAHNQLEAERAFGTPFMNGKREAAQRAAEAAADQSADLLACLRSLGFRAAEARRATESPAVIGEATLEERVRAALRLLCPKRGTTMTVRAPAVAPATSIP